jgi:hypothetical protein
MWAVAEWVGKLPFKAMFFKQWPEEHQFSAAAAVGFRRKVIAKIISDTERIKSLPIHVCHKAAFVG